MSELRYNPLLDTYTIVAANRQRRPNLEKDYCPFCIGKDSKVPEHYDVLVYPNDFPALDFSYTIDDSKTTLPLLQQKKAAKGGCDVILYSPIHNANLYDLSDEHVAKLIQLWQERFKYYQQQNDVKYIYPFENRGEEVGVTMAHPHGQLYAYPFIPLKIKTELDNCHRFFQQHQQNMFDVMIREEQEYNERIIFETNNFLVFLPFFTDYPYGLFIVAKHSQLFVTDFNNDECIELAKVLKAVVKIFDAIFDSLFPFMMCIHQGVVNSDLYTTTEQRQFYRFHIEFYPPLRAANTIKYYASSEMGAWAAANTRKVEDTAQELRLLFEALKIKI